MVVTRQLQQLGRQLNWSFQSCFWSQTMFLCPYLASPHKSLPSFKDMRLRTWKGIFSEREVLLLEENTAPMMQSERSVRTRGSVGLFSRVDGRAHGQTWDSLLLPWHVPLCRGTTRNLGEARQRRQLKTFRQMDWNIYSSTCAKKEKSHLCFLYRAIHHAIWICLSTNLKPCWHRIHLLG